MRPFILFTTRDDDVLVEAEYQAFCELSGLDPSELVHIRLDQGPMPEIDLAGFSGIFMGGSPFTATDPQETKSAVQVRVEREVDDLLDRVVAEDFPYMGACYGVGTLGTHVGAKIDTTYGEAIGAVEVTVTEEGRADPLLAKMPDAFDAYVGHKEAVRELPAEAVLLIRGEDCPVQMFRIKQNLYATQFHPELTRDGLIQRIEAYDGYGYYEPAEKAGILAAVEGTETPDAPGVLRAFVERYGG